MRRLLSTAAIALFVLPLLFVHAQTRNGPFSLAPDRPTIGAEIAVAYSADVSPAPLKDAGAIDCQALVARDGSSPLLIETPMKRDGSVWKATFTLRDPKARLLLFRFASGDKLDDNGTNVWTSLVYGKDGKPEAGSLFQLATLLKNGRMYDFKAVSNREEAAADLKRELELHPGYPEAQGMLWSMAIEDDPSDATRGAVRKEIDEFYRAHGDDEHSAIAVIGAYRMIGDTSKGEDVRKEGLAKFPKGELAFEARALEARKTDDLARRTEIFRSILQDFPWIDSGVRTNFTRALFSTYVAMKEYDKAADFLDHLDHPEGSMYNSLSWPLIESGDRLETAVAWAKKGVDICRNPDPSQKPSSMSLRDWKESSRYDLGAVLDTYGFGLFKLGKYADAENAYAEAYDAMKGEDGDADNRYIESLVRNGHNDRAMEVGFACVRQGKDSPEMMENVKAAFASKEGASGGFTNLTADQKKKFDDMVAVAHQAKIEELKSKMMKDRLNKPEVDFTLNTLDATPVTLSSLKGKVVVIDFWATWCGPCRASFPSFQKVYDKYKGDDKVVFLALDTWERTNDNAVKLANARKFMADNKYTFPVLMDENMVDRYGVDGIPTKFIIDKSGKIAFRSVGFNGAQQTVDELTLGIELLLAEPTPSTD